MLWTRHSHQRDRFAGRLSPKRHSMRLSQSQVAQRRLLLCTLAATFVVLLGGRFLWYNWGYGYQYKILRMPTIGIIPAQEEPLPLDYTAAIVYLGSLYRMQSLVLSLFYLFHNLKTPPYPIVIFHTGDFDTHPEQLKLKHSLYDYISAKSNKVTGELLLSAWQFTERIEFEKLDWELPSNLPDREALEPITAPENWPGYQHMCAFFAYHIFQNPRLRNVTYYLRLDTDSFLHSPVCYDPFDRMHKRNLSYAFRYVHTDRPSFTHGMFDLVDQYAQEHPSVQQMMDKNGWKLPAPNKRGSTRFPYYYNNFEVVRLSAFQTPEVQDWLDELMSVPERIYKYRWGDAPIRYATVNMFLDVERDTEKFCAIPYFHWQDYSTCACDAN